MFIKVRHHDSSNPDGLLGGVNANHVISFRPKTIGLPIIGEEPTVGSEITFSDGSRCTVLDTCQEILRRTDAE